MCVCVWGGPRWLLPGLEGRGETWQDASSLGLEELNEGAIKSPQRLAFLSPLPARRRAFRQ